MSTSATPAARPRLVYLPPSAVPASGAPQGQQPAPAAAQQQAAAPAQPAAQPQPSPLPPGQPAEGAAQAKAAPNLLSRLLGLMPLAAGAAQAAVGFLITNGTISLAGLPVLGSVPAFLVGALVASTAVPSILQGVGKLLGKR